MNVNSKRHTTPSKDAQCMILDHDPNPQELLLALYMTVLIALVDLPRVYNTDLRVRHNGFRALESAHLYPKSLP